MELNKDDITNIAYQRFNKEHGKRFWGILLGWLAVFVVVVFAIRLVPESTSWPIALAVVFPMAAGLLASMYFFYNRPQSRYVRAFIEECEANSALTYVPESAKETETVSG